MSVFFTTIKFVALFSYAVLLLFTFRSKTERSVRIFFSIYLTGMLFWQFGSVMVSFAIRAEDALLWYNLMIGGSGTFTILFFPFTRVLLRTERFKILAALSYIASVLVLAMGILGMEWEGVSLGRGGYWVPVFNTKWLYVVAVVSYFFWGFSVYNLIRGVVNEKSPVQRNRIVYVLIGASVVMVGVLSNLVGLRDYPIDISFNLASAFIIGYAVVRHKLLDIRFVLVRSLLYSILTSALIVVYLGVVLGLESVLKVRIGYTGPASGLVATLVIALIFLPLRNTFQKALDRLFFREKSDYQKANQAFSHDITSLYDAEAIFDLAGSTIKKSVKVDSFSFFQLDEGQKLFRLTKSFGSKPAFAVQEPIEEQSPLVHWLQSNGRPLVREEAVIDPQTRPLVKENQFLFQAEDVCLVVPIILKNKLIGMMNLGPKLSGAMYNDDDMRFLTTVANQTAMAIEKSAIFHEIERRLSEQTLLFILSEKFRSSADFDSIMITIVQILRNFLRCETCAIVCFEKEGGAKAYALDPLSEKAAEIAAKLQSQDQAKVPLRRDALPIDTRAIKELAVKVASTAKECDALSSLIYFPLQSGSTNIGMLIIPNRLGGDAVDTRELELMRTIRAIISQGIILYGTILNLMSLKTYNENILNSLNDMGDTLVILDLWGIIKKVNKATCVRLGYSMEELIGRPMSFLTGKEETLFKGEGLAGFVAAGSISNYEMSYRSRDGATIPMLFSGSVMTGEDGKRREIVGIARDITEHIKAEEMTKNILLIKEIHHRIKNNLQVISSLLYLQSGYVQEDKTREMFRESQNRIRSMAILHEKLYQSSTPAGIAFADYIKDLARNLFMSYGEQAASVALSVEIEDINLGMDTAVPCGLIVNELVSNALKHAFPQARSGNIRITMVEDGQAAAQGQGSPAREKRAGQTGGTDRDVMSVKSGYGQAPAPRSAAPKWYTLSVSDDGRGFPEGLDFKTTDSLGLKLVCTLAEQLKAAISLETEGGTRFSITFKEI